ncbi:S-adenosyl-L-homocysteine hydrolase [Croceicoccus sp. Ery5]|uniref:S-adenosyl-L-homocysteine hydrolase n=1 Tax=Croceicoccus sp. Ery5 TaxID=1703340 RepID=UPI001E52251C|nr:S-adenosyl-L-homocysteine hydrolase [Croceicoccus sp. Ery5]
MGTFGKIAAAASAAAMLVAAPATAATQAEVSQAESLRKLDIMLMVTSLRCRKGAFDFQADYNEFSAKRLPIMKSAYATLKSGHVARLGERGAKREMDKISVGMANQYGLGHPWLECDQLKQVTQDLAHNGGHAELLLAAEHLLAPARPAQFAMVD